VKDEIVATYKGAERDHFAIMPNVSNLQKAFWEKEYGINILSYDTKDVEVTGIVGHKRRCKDHNELLRLLQDLQSILKERPTIKAVIPARQPTRSFAVQFRSSLIRYCEAILHTFSALRSNGFALTAVLRKDLSPDIKLGHDYGRYSSQFATRIPVQELLDSFGNLILIAPPGAGKTHAVTTYAAILAENTLKILRSGSKLTDSDIRHSIPLVLSMREYTGDIKEMIISRLPRSIDANEALECGCLVLIFDAVNEVPRNLVETKVLADNISWLINRYPQNKFIFTSRTMNYVSFWALPVFELRPISYRILESYLMESCGIPLSKLHHEMIEILRNPLFLTLFVQAKKDERDKISNATGLLRQYFSRIEERVIRETELRDLPLMKLLKPIAYRLVDQGSQTVTPDRILASFHRTLRDYPLLDSKRVDIFKILISLGVLVPDAEGNVGFFHQSVLEYLAAVKLASLYQKDPPVLEEKVNLLRWDEAIMLFISLLPPDQSEDALTQIAEIDTIFACRSFGSATFREKDIGIHLFDMVSRKLSDSSLSSAEKVDLAEAIDYLAPYGRKGILIGLLDDPIIAGAASIFLASMGVKEAIPKITELLLRDNVWPSDFAEALELLADESLIHHLIEHGKQAEIELAMDNLAEILKNFESDFLYSEISKLVNSKVVRERRFATEILRKMDSNKSREFLAKMLSDSDHEVRVSVIFGLSSTFTRKPYRTAEIVSQMFKLLADKESGRWAASYLEELADNEIIEEALDRLQKSVNKYESINLSTIIAKHYPEFSKRVIFDALHNYDPTFHESLYKALASLGWKHIVPAVFAYLKTEDAKLRLTVLEALHFTLHINEQLPISKEDCQHLITLWENSKDFYEQHKVGFLLVDHCSKVSKDMLLNKFSDASYPFRERLIELVARLPLAKGDLSSDVINWLITKLDCRSDRDPRYHRNPTALILGKVCDESILREKLIPLLHSKNEVVRSNSYTAIDEAERTLGRRFIKK